MLVIRFQRVGRKNDPAFRIVITERRSKPKSGEREIVGSHHPKTKETRLRKERISYWLGHGARPSPRVHNLLVRHGVIKAAKIPVGRASAAPSAAPGSTPPPAAEPVSAGAVDSTAESS